jgi:hypothetical protein
MAKLAAEVISFWPGQRCKKLNRGQSGFVGRQICRGSGASLRMGVIRQASGNGFLGDVVEKSPQGGVDRFAIGVFAESDPVVLRSPLHLFG